MNGEGITYASSGVDIDLKSRFIDLLVKELTYRRKGKGRSQGRGHFTSAIPFGNFMLTLGTDGVGSKLLIARELGKWDTVGIDCVAMNANDTICIGAEPLALVDYVALPFPDTEVASQIGRGLNKGAELANAEIVGGEVAVLKDMVSEIDISASCLGVVRRDRMVTGSSIRQGNEIVGIASSGFHSNGYTLIRALMKETGTNLKQKVGSQSLGSILLRPTEIYVRAVLKALGRHNITGMANITGGGFRNLIRLKGKVRFQIDDMPRTPAVFNFISSLGSVKDSEMFQTFNMGVGFVIVTDKGEGDNLCSTLKAEGKRATVIGRVEKGSGVHLSEYDVSYDRY